MFETKKKASFWCLWLAVALSICSFGCGASDGESPDARDTAGVAAGAGGEGGVGGAGGVGGVGGIGGVGGLELLPEAEEDDDGIDAPAVYAQFRATSPNPVSVAEPLFNDIAIDTRGLQYINAVSVPGDDEDVVQFRIVPGQTDPTIRVSLECDATDPARISAELVDADLTVIETIQCGDEDINVVLKNATSLDELQVLVSANGDDPVYGDFTLSINGTCFQQCDYLPFEG